MVTIYKNIYETSNPFYRDCGLILNRIKEGASKNLIQKIRLQTDKKTRDKMKKRLPAICFSGTFNKRNDKSIIDHSGLICLDFDNYKTEEDLLNAKKFFSKDKYVYSVFISPSKHGLKVLVKIPTDIDNHIKTFNSLKGYFKSEFFDITCKNISRVCYESFDSNIYINKSSAIFNIK